MSDMTRRRNEIRELMLAVVLIGLLVASLF